MERIQVQTNKGIIFNWCLTKYLNLVFLIKGVRTEEDAINVATLELLRIEKLFL